MTVPADVEILADHSALLAIPAFAPAILVVGVVIWVARRDRRKGADDDDDRVHSEGSASADEDGSP